MSSVEKPYRYSTPIGIQHTHNSGVATYYAHLLHCDKINDQPEVVFYIAYDYSQIYTEDNLADDLYYARYRSTHTISHIIEKHLDGSKVKSLFSFWRCEDENGTVQIYTNPDFSDTIATPKETEENTITFARINEDVYSKICDLLRGPPVPIKGRPYTEAQRDQRARIKTFNLMGV